MTTFHDSQTPSSNLDDAMMYLLLQAPALLSIFLWTVVELYGWNIRRQNRIRRLKLLQGLGHKEDDKKTLLGFFHPYSNTGGGGERVLWTAIAHIQRTRPNVVSVVYSGDTDATKQEILAKVKARFDIDLDESHLDFVFLKSRSWVEDSAWPRLTLLGQSLGSIYLAWEAMSQLIPELFIDTMGYAFTFHVVSLIGKIPIGAYVHYPTISTDMLERVKARKRWHTNRDNISSSVVLSQAKLLYYRVFMYYYSMSLRTASFIMVNSTWTKEHIDAILNYSNLPLDILNLIPPLVFLKLFTSSNAPEAATIVYPPCDTKATSLFNLESRKRVILSVAQFRPEKDHTSQLHAFHRLLEKYPQYRIEKNLRPRLVLIGGARNEDDTARVDRLRGLVGELGIQEYVEFAVNAPYSTVLEWLSKASIGVNTMVDEHFGINVVEYMSAGVIPVTHASGGPLKDIVVPFNNEITGYHAKTPEEYADAFHQVFSMTAEEELGVRRRARTWAVQTFSEAEFEREWDKSGWDRYV